MANVTPNPPAKQDVTVEEPKGFPKDSYEAKFKEFRKIKIFEVPGETNDVFLNLGDYPHVVAVRGREIVLPTVLIKGCLDGSVVETFKHIDLQVPDETGNVFRRVDTQVVRFPYQDIGPATEADWKAQISRK